MTDADWSAHCGDLAATVAPPDVLERLGPMPRSCREAAALYRRFGVRTLEGLVTALLGPPIDRRQASRGDIVMVRGALGICRGEVIEGLGGAARMKEVDRAWPIRAAARTCRSQAHDTAG